jgi:hypothetical protein
VTTSATRKHGLPVWACLLNATLLSVHEIDSAYWHEPESILDMAIDWSYVLVR